MPRLRAGLVLALALVAVTGGVALAQRFGVIEGAGDEHRPVRADALSVHSVTETRRKQSKDSATPSLCGSSMRDDVADSSEARDQRPPDVAAAASSARAALSMLRMA
jgi:hypothetical protein